MLVVIAIVAILSAVAAFGGMAVVRSARSTTCLGNLGQLYKAAHLYETDNGGLQPPSPLVWADVRDEDGYTWKQDLMRYGPSDEVFYGPSDRYARSPMTTRADFGSFQYTSYTWGLTHLQYSSRTKTTMLFSLESPPHPSDTIFLYDNTITRQDPDSGERWYESAHKDTLNAVYFDGHVKTIPIFKP